MPNLYEYMKYKSWGIKSPQGNKLGKGWKHACSLRIRFRKDTLLDENNKELSSKAENPAGNRVGMEIIKTKVCKPNRRLGYYTLKYLKGVDTLYDMINVCMYYKIVQQAGSWYRVIDDQGNIALDKEGNELNFQGMTRFLDYLHKHENEVQQLLTRLNGVMLDE